MPRKWRWGVILAIVIASLVGGRATTATSQQDPVNLAGMVVDYGNGEVSYALIPFTGDEISGIDLLHASGLPLLTVDFGAMGEGVCIIREVGCDLSPCRSRLCQTGDPDSPFWQYFQRTETGDWQFTPLGASSSKVTNGDVEGWFWTGSEPNKAAPTLDEVASALDVDLETIRRDSSGQDDAVSRTIGTSSEMDSGPDLPEILAGAAVVAGLAVVGGWVILRSRRTITP